MLYYGAGYNMFVVIMGSKFSIGLICSSVVVLTPALIASNLGTSHNELAFASVCTSVIASSVLYVAFRFFNEDLLLVHQCTKFKTAKFSGSLCILTLDRQRFCVTMDTWLRRVSHLSMYELWWAEERTLFMFSMPSTIAKWFVIIVTYSRVVILSLQFRVVSSVFNIQSFIRPMMLPLHIHGLKLLT